VISIDATGNGRRIGRYQLEEVIGRGAFAAVHRATDDHLQDTVAVKVLGDNHATDPDIRARFIAEGRCLRRLDSPHVVRVHDLGETDQGQPYLVLELADRGTLKDRVSELRSGGWRAEPADIAAVARSLADAVGTIHRAGFVHRDLSPRNVLLRSADGERWTGPPETLVAPDERLLVADLGLAKDLAGHSGLTRAGGTDGFRPPEQRAGLGRVDERADVWGLSALVAWLVTGEAPGDQGDQADRLIATAVREAGAPPGLGEALEVGLRDDPTRRYADVAAWQAAVRAAVEPPTGGSGPGTQVTAPGGPRPRHGAAGSSGPTDGADRRRSWPARVATLAVGAGLGIGGLLGIRYLGPGDRPEVEGRGDGIVEVAEQSGDTRVAIVGPETVEAGEVAAFEAAVEGVDRWVWYMPDGQVAPDAPEVSLRAVEPGRADVTLVRVTDAGDPTEVTATLPDR
jgi:eukaryotic-like serine/threonine-protein kinase